MEGIFNTEIMVDIALWTILTVVPIESVAAWGSDQGWEHVYGCIYRDFKNQSKDLSWFDGWEYWSGKHTKYQARDTAIRESASGARVAKILKT